MSNTPYFTMKKTEDSADIYIFGDIVPWKWDDSDTTSYDLATQIKALPEDTAITIHINSNGGDLKEGLGIYNVLKGRNVTTICEGFAASSASVIFCAGSKRVMNAASLLFIHNASMLAAGTADDFEKAADDLRIITDAAKAAYREAGVNVSDVELDRMMDEETWITPADAVNWGFATEIAEADQNGIRNDAMQAIMRAVVPQDERKEDDAVVSMRELVDRLTAAVSALESHTITNTADRENEAEAEAPAADPEEEATTPTPAPAQVENKGFFGFSKN
jgi:ATP-dependent protease ClpP protease subunit